ncbi:alpha-1,3-arabinosyltransferase XAT3-like [Magnolia sinica]|uniref:alpha-1,3-arabinosyltransferase XAT3-like n=1 Tax=Magnolia sinica TaxID=86752 RepID=UPI002658AF75|nr:alpha-1,3-arabinosyltransferase XAT3-like [Magnolia sinica]
MGKESKRPSCGAAVTICLFLLPLLYIGIRRSSSWQSDFSSLSSWRMQISHGSGGLSSKNNTESIEMEGEFSKPFQRLVRGKERRELDTTGVSCFSDPLSDVCVIKQNVRIDTSTMTVYIAPENQPPMQYTVRPYARKTDNTCMEAVTPVEVRTIADDNRPACQVTHTVPVVVFSTGGFASNLFHDFNDIIIPLFLTSRNFRSQLMFAVTDFMLSWIRKYHPILAHLSSYDPIDTTKDRRVHCFPGAVIGLKYHSDFTCNASDVPGGYSTLDFKRFLRESFNLKDRNRTEAAFTRQEDQKPNLVLISRRNSRQFLNEDELVGMARELGFHVTVASPQRVANLQKFAQVVHSCDVLVGAHGAGIANSLFLPEGAVLVQVVPLGLNWASTTYYGDPSRAMGIHYLEYQVTYNESSLSDTYPPDHPVIADPNSIHLQGYRVSRAVYVDGQNLRLDLARFKETLLQAMQRLRWSAR